MIANMVGVQMDIKHVPCLKVYAAAIQITPSERYCVGSHRSQLEEGLRRTYIWIEKQVRDAPWTTVSVWPLFLALAGKCELC